MSFPILGLPLPTFLDSSGNPLTSGTLSVLEPTDDTNKAYYPSADDADAGTNPASGDITLNARGEPGNALFGIDDQKYKLVLKDSIAATIWTVDDIRLPVRLPTLYGKTAQTLTDAGAVTLTESTTFIVTTGAAAITLADGVENQHKLIVMKTDAGVATLTPTNLSNGTTIVFDDVGDSADLWFVDGSWNFLGGSAFVTGYSADTAITFISTDATPTVAGGETFITAGTTAITDFDDGVVGQTIKILAASDLVITHGTPIQLRHNINFDINSGETLTLHMFNDQVWEEVARSGAEIGSFTPTHTGFSSAPSGTVQWSREGSLVTLQLPFLTGTSDATTWTITNLPAVLTPTRGQTLPIIGMHDNGSDQAAAGVVIISGTTLTFGLDGTDANTGGGFTAANAKGFSSIPSITYSLFN